jgi:hypothetical protein
MQWNILSNGCTGGVVMAAGFLIRRMTVRLPEVVAFAQIGNFGFNGQIELEALRHYGLSEAAPSTDRDSPSPSARRRA